MKNPQIYMKPLVLASLVAASCSVSAAPGQAEGKVTFQAAANAEVIEKQSINFGENLAVAKGSTCTIVALLALDGNRLKAGASTFDGTSCGEHLDADGEVRLAKNKASTGLFEITGIAGQIVGVNFETSTDNGMLQFSPVVKFYNGSLSLYTDSAPVVAAVADLVGDGSEDLTLNGLQSLVEHSPHPLSVGTLAVGGTLETLARLEASTPYDMNYTLNIVYK